MTTFIAVYRGASIADARLVAVSADPALVAYVSSRLLRPAEPLDDDPALARLERGRRGALRVIAREARHDSATERG